MKFNKCLFFLMIVFFIVPMNAYSRDIHYYLNKYKPYSNYKKDENIFGGYSYSFTCTLNKEPMEVVLREAKKGLKLSTIDGVIFDDAAMKDVEDNIVVIKWFVSGGCSKFIDDNWRIFASEIEGFKATSIYKQYIDMYSLSSIYHDYLFNKRYAVQLIDDSKERHEIEFQYENNCWKVVNNYATIRSFKPLTPLEPNVVFTNDIFDPYYSIILPIRGTSGNTDLIKLTMLIMKDNSKEYEISIVYEGEKSKNLDGNLRMKVGTQKLTLSTLPKKKYEDSNFEEILTYKISKEEFLSIISCNSLVLQYWEDDVIRIGSDAINAMHNFETNYIDLKYEEVRKYK